MELGVSTLGAHLFIFYFAVLSAITPPVALAVFAAAAIAKENPIMLALNALRLALVGFVLPVAWVYHPEILIGTKGTGFLDALRYLPFLLTAIVGLSASHVGYLFRPIGGRVADRPVCRRRGDPGALHLGDRRRRGGRRVDCLPLLENAGEGIDSGVIPVPSVPGRRLRF